MGSVFLLTFKNGSFSVFKRSHSWLSGCFLGKLNSTTVLPHQQSEVGQRERSGKGSVYCAFSPQGQGSFQSITVLVLNHNPNLRQQGLPISAEMPGHFNTLCLGNRQSSLKKYFLRSEFFFLSHPEPFCYVQK